MEGLGDSFGSSCEAREGSLLASSPEVGTVVGTGASQSSCSLPSSNSLPAVELEIDPIAMLHSVEDGELGIAIVQGRARELHAQAQAAQGGLDLLELGKEREQAPFQPQFNPNLIPI